MGINKKLNLRIKQLTMTKQHYDIINIYYKNSLTYKYLNFTNPVVTNLYIVNIDVMKNNNKCILKRA